jgi:hypothetical protein
MMKTRVYLHFCQPTPLVFAMIKHAADAQEHACHAVVAEPCTIPSINFMIEFPNSGPAQCMLRPKAKN